MTRRLSHFATGALALLLAQPAFAAEEYVFDQSHTEIRFQVDHFGYSTITGEFHEFDGMLLLDEDDIANSSVEVTIDLRSLDTGWKDRDDHFKSEDFFEVAEYPEATFESTVIEANGQDRHRVDGELTIHGITRPVTLDVQVNKIGEHPVTGARTIGFDAMTTIERSAFDAGMYAPAVSDEVEIRITSEMPRKADLDDD